MPGEIPNLKSWVLDLASISTYAERSWRDLSKGRWEAKTHGLGKDVIMRPPSDEEETLAPVPKLAKDNKRKRASASEDPQLKTRMTRKPRKNTIPMTEESVRCLRDEDDEEEKDDFILVARVKKTIDALKTAGSMVVDKASPRTEGVSKKHSGKVLESLEIEDASHQSELTVDIFEGTGPESLQTKENAPSDSFGALDLHQEAFSKSRAELSRCEADFRVLSEEINALKLLSGQKEEEIKALRAMLGKVYQDHTDLIEQEKSSAQARKIEELEARLDSKLAKAKSKAENAMSEADAIVAIYRANGEASQVQRREASETAQTRAYWIAKLAKCQSRRETLEEIHARGFDLTNEIEKARENEAKAGALSTSDDDDDDGSKSGSDNGEDLDVEEVAPGGYQEP
ncbi:uncharacterized protein [Nicotiana tomentosiformis]|uniref:uncharacterized protein n=1 Tax=Nicotiana tomentosiformis TaxID=4098 RepID=UPI00388C773E